MKFGGILDSLPQMRNDDKSATDTVTLISAIMLNLSYNVAARMYAITKL